MWGAGAVGIKKHMLLKKSAILSHLAEVGREELKMVSTGVLGVLVG